MCGYLPEEVLQEILLRLPVKSLVQCTCVCKVWNSLIKNPTFIAAHMRRTIPTNGPLLLSQVCNEWKGSFPEENYHLHYDKENIIPYKRISLPISLSTGSTRVLDSINGVICLANDDRWIGYYYILWNPFIEKYLCLPDPEFIYMRYGPYNHFEGFGHSSGTNDFKVLRMVELDEFYGIERCLQVEVFSLNAGTWKNITSMAPKGIHVLWPRPQAFVNGVIHCICYRPDGRPAQMVVVGFDVSNECFCEIMLPKECVETSDLPISKYKDSTIAVFQCTGFPRTCNVWVMKEYGVAESWTKIYTITGETLGDHSVLPDNFSVLAGFVLPPNLFRKDYYFCRPLGFTEKGDILLETECGNILSLNIKTQETSGPICEGRGHPCFTASHVESLMLLDKAIRIGQGDISHVADDTLSGADVGNDEAISERDENRSDYEGDELCT